MCCLVSGSLLMSVGLETMDYYGGFSLGIYKEIMQVLVKAKVPLNCAKIGGPLL